MNKYDYQSEWSKGPGCVPAMRRRMAKWRLILGEQPQSWMFASTPLGESDRAAFEADMRRRGILQEDNQ